MRLDPHRTAVLGLHWTVNVTKPEGFFAAMLSEPVARSGVIPRAAHLHQAARSAGVTVVYTRFTVPTDGGQLVRNTQLVSAVADAPENFRPDSPGSEIIPEMPPLTDGDRIVDNQKLSGLAGNDLAEWLTHQGITTLLLTGVATNLTVEQTARHATDLGFFVHVIADCVTAADENAHAAAMANFELGTAGSLGSAEAIERLRPAGR
ncbi:cysteine hydrolase [Spiractinospora alimapuensis]|uniref:cysteine hydrolase family protein n=1 Tax=Spiractinospora alimapuensis TaxID=2820884 RepID=UPI001F359744|nr:cysteine hydrolase [Spiractinospora alimapuensis]QVQ51112.1 cysteine hydrolase [Spiractinospora alimapuensis]